MDVIAGDGSYKAVYLVNDKLPGPPVVVYEGQEVCGILYIFYKLFGGHKFGKSKKLFMMTIKVNS